VRNASERLGDARAPQDEAKAMNHGWCPLRSMCFGAQAEKTIPHVDKMISGRLLTESPMH
jgi:hypothetical protein